MAVSLRLTGESIENKGEATPQLKGRRSLNVYERPNGKPKAYRHVLRRSHKTIPSANAYGPKRPRYSLLLVKAFTISAATKSPLNWFSFASQKLKPSKLRLSSGASFGFRRR